MKINKNTPNAYTYYKKYNKNTMYIMQELRSQELRIFHNYLELSCKSFYLDVIFSHCYYHYILQLIYQLTFFLHLQFL